MRKNETVKTEGEKKKKLNILFIVLPILISILLTVSLVLILRKENTKDPDGTLYTYYLKKETFKNAKLQRSQKDKTEIVMEDRVQIAANLPLYYESRKAFIIPERMVYYSPKSGMIPYKAEYFSVFKEKTGRIYLEGVSEEEPDTQLLGGFLFDGVDFYIFLEPVVLEYNHYSIELPAFSFVEASYINNLCYFDYEKQEFSLDKDIITTDVIVKSQRGDFALNMYNDSAEIFTSQSGAGEKYLLFTRPELLDPIPTVGAK